MSKEKYCIETSRSRDQSILSRNTEAFVVTVDPAKAKKQSLHVYQTKNGNKSSYDFPPKTDEYTIVKATSKEDFENAYHRFLRAIRQCNINAGEYYLVKRTNGSPNGMAWYSSANETKMGLQISFYNESKDFSLTVDCINTWQGVQHFRRAGNTLDKDKFHSFFKVILNFLHDFNNYCQNHSSLVHHFKSIVEGEKPEIQVGSDWTADNNLAKEAINNRIATIEKRLIEFDTDAPKERIKLRGELDGLRFALNCI